MRSAHEPLRHLATGVAEQVNAAIRLRGVYYMDLHGLTSGAHPTREVLGLLTPQRGAPLRIATLVRVSTTHLEQADSPQHQMAYIDGETRREGWLNTGLVYRAELTGAVILNRPDIQRMLCDAAAGLFDAIVLKSISRLGRDTLGLLTVKRRLDDDRVELIALADGYRSFRDPELIFLVYAERAQAGRQEISKNVRAGIVEAARRGIWPAGTLPFGLRKVDRFTIGPDPETAPIVGRIFELRQQHWGLVQICQHLNAELRVKAPGWWHLRTQIQRLEATGGAERDERIQQRLRRLKERLLTGRFVWHPKTIRIILQNTAYFGELRYNRTLGQRKMHGQLRRAGRGQGDWVVLPCTPLITKETWDQVQAVEEVRARLPPKSLASRFLLSGLLTCGCCGYALRGEPARRNTGQRGGDPKGYYVCRGSIESGLHAPERIRATDLEQAILAQLRAELHHVLPPDVAPSRRRKVDPAKELARIAEQLRDLAEAKFYRREEQRKGTLSAAEFAFEMALIIRKEEELHARSLRLGQGQAVAPGDASRQGAVADMAARLVRLEGPEEVLKALLPTLVQKVVVHTGQRVELHTTFTREELTGRPVTASNPPILNPRQGVLPAEDQL